MLRRSFSLVICFLLFGSFVLAQEHLDAIDILEEVTQEEVPEVPPARKADTLLPDPKTIKVDQYTALMQKLEKGLPLPQKEFFIVNTGDEGPIDFSQFGKFNNLGTPEYEYKLENSKGLSEAMGAGLLPNTAAVKKEPQYEEIRKKGLLWENHWVLYESDDLLTAFFAWAECPELAGVKAYFIAKIMERAGYFKQALKSYHSCLVLYPRSVAWGKDGNYVWYIAPAAIANIERLCRDYPQLGLDFVDAMVTIENGDDTNLDNDVIAVNPGRFIPLAAEDRFKNYADFTQMNIIKTIGTDNVKLVNYENGHWQLLVEGNPYIIRGITYTPTKIGLGPMNNAYFLSNWMFSDINNNDIADAPYESWVDENDNGKRDEFEKGIGDFQLLKDMGINTIRLFVDTPGIKYDPTKVNKDVLRDLHEKYGIRVIVGNYLGAYLHGSGAVWARGTDYTDSEQRENMKRVVRKMVMDLKDEPFVLMWLLGNENNLPVSYFGANATRTNAAQRPKAYSTFLNEVAEMIHEIDPVHPVAVGNIELGLLDYYKKYAPAIDVLGINSYRGKDGFDSLWRDAKSKFDRPVLITEYGHDAYHDGVGEVERTQQQYHQGCIRDIIFNQAGGRFQGNAIGGVIFEFLDEWWKDTAGDPDVMQSKRSQVIMPFSDGYSHEEWLGIVGQGSGRNSPLERKPRKSYYFYKDLWR